MAHYLMGEREAATVRRRGRQRTRWLDGIINSIDMSLSKLREMVKGEEVHRVTGLDTAEQLNNNSV